MKFYGISKDSTAKFSAAIKAKMIEHLISLTGKDICVEITERDKRSNQQNRYWWQLMTILEKEHPGAMRKEEWHEVCKYKFLKRERVDESTGEILEYLKSTTDLNKKEFNELIEQLQIWASMTFGINLPDPEQQIDSGL